MIQLLKHTFSRICVFYREALEVKRNVHYYAAFVLALLVFANVYTFINGFTLLAFHGIGFDYRSPLFILIGDTLVLSVIALVSIKQRYKVLIIESQALPTEEKQRLDMGSNGYIVITLVLLLGVMLGSTLV